MSVVPILLCISIAAPVRGLINILYLFSGETLSESFGVPVRLVPENLPERPGYTSVIAVGKTKTATAADSLREAS